MQWELTERLTGSLPKVSEACREFTGSSPKGSEACWEFAERLLKVLEACWEFAGSLSKVIKSLLGWRQKFTRRRLRDSPEDRRGLPKSLPGVRRVLLDLMVTSIVIN
ncbi:hypothetical protein BHM03_00028077 [Ensete ventricosum]|nr:hypothetical protein BHM03_00028077 [Ensete ventricosum]